MTGRARPSRDNTASVAARFGVSSKALRLYEERGLLKPARNRQGWRVYGPAEFERLEAIVALKRLGLSLARIAEAFSTREPDLDALLDAREAALRDQRSRADAALGLLRLVRARFGKGDRPPPDEVAAFVTAVHAGAIHATPEITALKQRCFTPAQIAAMNCDGQDDETLLRINEGWPRIYAEIDQLLPDGDPTSETALAIVRRARALMSLSSRDDPGLEKGAAQFWSQAMADPKVSRQLPMTPAQWSFLLQAGAELRRREATSPP